MLGRHKKTKVIIVDDEIEITNLIEFQLKHLYPEKLEITCLTDPKKALSLAKRKEYKILITDLCMPKFPGEALICDSLKVNKGLQVIVISCLDTLISSLSCYNEGVMAYINKPFKKEELQSAMDMCLHKLHHWEILMKRNVATFRKKSLVNN